jgi:hypothetical protein
MNQMRRQPMLVKHYATLPIMLLDDNNNIVFFPLGEEEGCIN